MFLARLIWEAAGVEVHGRDARTTGPKQYREEFQSLLILYAARGARISGGKPLGVGYQHRLVMDQAATANSTWNQP